MCTHNCGIDCTSRTRKEAIMAEIDRNISLRQFNSIEEVKRNLDTITYEECCDIYDRLSIVFLTHKGNIIDACYEDELPKELSYA